jgi:hypothetical protein
MLIDSGERYFGFFLPHRNAIASGEFRQPNMVFWISCDVLSRVLSTNQQTKNPGRRILIRWSYHLAATACSR